jgi:hypothetical protein
MAYLMSQLVGYLYFNPSNQVAQLRAVSDWAGLHNEEVAGVCPSSWLCPTSSMQA